MHSGRIDGSMTIFAAKNKTKILREKFDEIVTLMQSDDLWLEPGLIYCFLDCVERDLMTNYAIVPSQTEMITELNKVDFKRLTQESRFNLIKNEFDAIITEGRVEIWHSQKVHRVVRNWSEELWNESGLENTVELDLFPVLKPQQKLRLRNSMWNDLKKQRCAIAGAKVHNYFLSYLTNSSTL